MSFSNPIARRVAFLMSLGILLVTLIPGASLFSPLWWLVGGLGAVHFYRRITGVSLTVRAGAHLGSLTGILAFVSFAVITGLSFVASGNELKQAFKQALVKQNPQVTEVLNNPPELAMLIALSLVLSFAVVVGICAAGGALGARFTNRNAGV